MNLFGRTYIQKFSIGSDVSQSRSGIGQESHRRKTNLWPDLGLIFGSYWTHNEEHAIAHRKTDVVDLLGTGVGEDIVDRGWQIVLSDFV